MEKLMWKVMIADDENYMLEAMENLIDWKRWIASWSIKRKMDKCY